MEVFFVFVVWTLFCVGVGALASYRGRSGVGFFLLSFFLSPLLGLIVVLIMRNLAEESAREESRRREESSRDNERMREHEKQLESIRALTAKRPATESSFLTPSPSPLIADELGKLAALVDAGHLTREEFVQQKGILLGKSKPLVQTESPVSVPTSRQQAATELSSQDKCISALVQRGCRVEKTVEGTWNVHKPNGATAHIRSIEVLRETAVRFVIGEELPN